ncbi:MAG: PaaI family thioesterase [Thermoleophilaceae bacterium]
MPKLIEHHPNCLACGSENPCGLGLHAHIDGDRIRGEVTIDKRHEGAPGFVHGGALATVLDDAVGSLLIILRRPAVTAKLEVNYRSPAFIDRMFEVEAWVDRTEGRKLHLAGEMRDGGEVVADCAALFLEVKVEHFLQGMEEIPEAWKHLPR